MSNILRCFQEYFKIYQTSVHSVSKSNSVDEMQSATNHYAVKITAIWSRRWHGYQASYQRKDLRQFGLLKEY